MFISHRKEVVDRVRGYTSHLAKILATVDDQPFPDDNFYANHALKGNRRKVVVTMKIPPPIQALINESHRLMMDEIFLKHTVGDNNESELVKVRVQRYIVDNIFVRWLTTNPMRLRILRYQSDDRYTTVVSKDWFLYVIRR